MKLRSLHIHRLPGISSPFRLDALAPGINVVVGPNASGKSSLMRALRAALYSEELAHATPLFVEAVFDDNGEELHAIRQGSQLTWQRAGTAAQPPALPERRFLPCFTLRIEDLLDQSNETDAQIAARLARELAGGYDIARILNDEPFHLKQNHARREAQAMREAQTELRRRQRDREGLRRDEDRLTGLERERDRAAEASRGADLCQRALELLKARRARRMLEEELNAFPESMDKLRGDELASLEKLRDQRRRQSQQLRQARDALADAQDRLQATGLDETGLDDATLNDWRNSVQRLQSLESTQQQTYAELTRARTRLDDAITALGGEPGRPVHLDLATVRQIEQQLRTKRALDGAIAALEHERDRLPAQIDARHQPKALERGRDELLRWLAAPTHPGWGPRRLVAMAAFAAAGLAAIGAATATFHWALLALLFPFGWGVYAFATENPGGAERRDAQRRYRDSGQPEPDSWTADVVRNRLHELDEAAQDARVQAALVERREQVQRELNQKERQRNDALAELKQLGDKVGHDPTLQDAPLDRWMHLTLAYDEARGRIDALEAEAERLKTQAQPLRSAAGEFLARHTESPDTDQPDADTLLARLDHLAKRIRDRDQAYKDIGRAESDIAQLSGDIQATDDALSELFAKAGVDDGDETNLRQRLDRLAQWKDKSDALREARAQEAVRQPELEGQEELLALIGHDDGEAALQRRHDELRSQAERYRALNEEIGGIREAIRLAGRERSLEQARARLQTSEDALRDRLDEALFAEAGDFLLERVQSEHVQTSQPAALRRAKEWFAHFTHHAWALDFASDGEARFAAVETATGERRGLAELSSGTRMQLLLAVRVAFALEAERGREPLPLVLDEALTTADPERFRAAAQSLQALAEDGRQVFYLTAQPVDLGYWKAHDPRVRCIDLAHARKQGTAVREPEAITMPEPTWIPAPDDRVAEDYAVELGVPFVDPWRTPSSVHIFYLLRDDLGLLHRLLQLRIERLGQLEALLVTPAAQAVLDEPERERLQWRAAGAKAWLRAWREGRGRPVDRAALEETDAVSDTFLKRVAALNAEVGGDARELIRRLEAGAVERFRNDKREALADFLAERGYLDGREPLSEAGIELRVLDVLAPLVKDRQQAIDETRSLSRSLRSGLGDSSAQSAAHTQEAADRSLTS